MSFPEKFNKFPIIVFTEILNGDKGICSKEVLTSIAFQIDIFAKSDKEITEIFDLSDLKMTELGFRRSFANDSNTGEIKRKTIRYSGVLNNRNNMMFQD